MITELDFNTLERLLARRPFHATDRAIVAHLNGEWGEQNPWLLFAAGLCSQATREGHAYLDLSRPPSSDNSFQVAWPRLETWNGWAQASGVISVDEERPPRPLVLSDRSALYLEKYYAYEGKLAHLVHARCQSGSAAQCVGLRREPVGSKSGQFELDLGASEPSTDPVERAANSAFFVITGGPGTGKTTLALRYLNTLLDGWAGSQPPRFAAVAPTGKAAARLAESIAQGLQRLDAPAERKDYLRRLPCLTIHRLLGTLPHRVSFRRHALNPIPYDTLVVDETSMIDLPLMARLFEALPLSCRLLLLGDRDQLASVEVGSVLHDILRAADTPGSSLASRVERLTKTYRFREDSSIFRACQLARQGDAEGFTAMLADRSDDFAFHSIDSGAQRCPEAALRLALERHERLARQASPEAALDALNDSVTLCPTRTGPFGTFAFNAAVERRIREQESLAANSPIRGLPIIVLENDYELELFNGDLGVVWHAADDEVGYAVFPGPKGKARGFRLSELPRHETAFALTIHKSQGSEFRETIGLFGPSDSQLLTRELLYTCFSRAKERLVLFGERDTLAAAIRRQATRATRLAERLHALGAR